MGSMLDRGDGWIDPFTSKYGTLQGSTVAVKLFSQTAWRGMVVFEQKTKQADAIMTSVISGKEIDLSVTSFVVDLSKLSIVRSVNDLLPNCD